MAARAWMKWIVSKARSFHYFQRPYLLPRWLRWIGWLAVVWTFYGVFTEVGLVHVYRRYRLSDADWRGPPSTFWILSPADEFGVLSAFQAPGDQIFGLIVATIVSAMLAIALHLRRSVASAIALVATIPLVFHVTAWLLIASMKQFDRDAIIDGLNDPSGESEVLWIGGEVEVFGAFCLPVATCLCIALAALAGELRRIVVMRQ